MGTEREAMTLDKGAKLIRSMAWGADVGEDMMRLADLLDHLSRAAERHITHCDNCEGDGNGQ